MAVMAREAWTDERLDDLKEGVEKGFGEMREEFRAIRSDVKGEFEAIRGEMREEMRGIPEEIGALNRSVIQLAFAIVGTVFLGFMGTIAALVTLV